MKLYCSCCMPMSKIMQLLHLSFIIVTLCLISGFILAVHGSNLHFTYYPNITGYYEFDFFYSEESNLAGGALQVTMDSRNSLLINQAGRVVHRDTLKLWGHKRTDVASFNTTFVLNILPLTNPGGEGLAFILTSNPNVPSNSYGPWLGIVNQETNGSSLNPIVAIEFDTRKSDSVDVDSNHIALDVNSINSIYQFPLDRSVVNLSSGMDVLVKIMYDGKLGNMTVQLSMGNGTVSNQPILSHSFFLNLTNYLPREVFVGFSASTSNFTELNCVRSWNFTSTQIRKGPLGPLQWVGIILGAIIFVVGLICFIVHKIKKNTAAVARNASGQFRLRELAAATSDFDETRILGRGGFGVVYKGTLKGVEVAIKRFNMRNSCHEGEREFFSEVATIGLLNHPNLVKLIGWCSERGELLLVYQYMCNGSLDQVLFSMRGDHQASVILSWPQRTKILTDVASALIYLHDDSQHRRIFHKDIKSSNVMLDAEMNAYLGDFGLARSVQEGISHHTTKVISGTACYVAPEYCYTGRASIKTDVYAFGALVAEACCGEKPIENRALPWTNNVVIRIGQFQRDGNILGAADPRLRGEFDEEMMKVVMNLALSCCQSDETRRPTSSLVLKVLMGEESLPDFVEQSPQSVFPDITPSASSRSTPAKTLQEHLEEDRHATCAITEIIGR